MVDHARVKTLRELEVRDWEATIHREHKLEWISVVVLWQSSLAPVKQGDRLRLILLDRYGNVASRDGYFDRRDGDGAVQELDVKVTSVVGLSAGVGPYFKFKLHFVTQAREV